MSSANSHSILPQLLGYVQTASETGLRNIILHIKAMIAAKIGQEEHSDEACAIIAQLQDIKTRIERGAQSIRDAQRDPNYMALQQSLGQVHDLNTRIQRLLPDIMANLGRADSYALDQASGSLGTLLGQITSMHEMHNTLKQQMGALDALGDALRQSGGVQASVAAIVQRILSTWPDIGQSINVRDLQRSAQVNALPAPPVPKALCMDPASYAREELAH